MIEVLSNVNYSMILNTPKGKILATGGNRLGDHFSPFLFTLVLNLNCWLLSGGLGLNPPI